jgi:hypothetical protein
MESFPLLELLVGTIRDSIAALVKPFMIIAHSLQLLSYVAVGAVGVWFIQVLKR